MRIIYKLDINNMFVPTLVVLRLKIKNKKKIHEKLSRRVMRDSSIELCVRVSVSILFNIKRKCGRKSRYDLKEIYSFHTEL